MGEQYKEAKEKLRENGEELGMVFGEMCALFFKRITLSYTVWRQENKGKKKRKPKHRKRQRKPARK